LDLSAYASFDIQIGDPAGVLTQSGHLSYNQLLSKIQKQYRTDLVPNFCPVLAVQRLRFSA